MKKILATFILVFAIAVCAFAKEQSRTTEQFTVSPAMHCENCEKKIKGNLRFEKGVTDIAIDRAAQTVTITFNPDKTDSEKLVKAFKKIGYTATPVKSVADSEK